VPAFQQSAAPSLDLPGTPSCAGPFRPWFKAAGHASRQAANASALPLQARHLHQREALATLVSFAFTKLPWVALQRVQQLVFRPASEMPLRPGFAERTLLKRFQKNLRRMRPCHGLSTLRSRNAEPKPPRRCLVPDWVFRWGVAHPHPRCPLPVSRKLTITGPISVSFLAKRKWPTSVSPRSISSIGRTLAAACS
jgi:hypothetical protein